MRLLPAFQGLGHSWGKATHLGAGVQVQARDEEDALALPVLAQGRLRAQPCKANFLNLKVTRRHLLAKNGHNNALGRKEAEM